jgi:hypothetical protein
MPINPLAERGVNPNSVIDGTRKLSRNTAQIRPMNIKILIRVSRTASARVVIIEARFS